MISRKTLVTILRVFGVIALVLYLIVGVTGSYQEVQVSKYSTETTFDMANMFTMWIYGFGICLTTYVIAAVLEALDEMVEKMENIQENFEKQEYPNMQGLNTARGTDSAGYFARTAGPSGERTAAPLSNGWHCPKCDTVNDNQRNVCRICGTRKEG